MAIETYILSNNEWILGSLVSGQPYKIINTTNGAVREGTSYVDKNNGLDAFSTANETITINGNAPITKQPVYFVANGDTISIQSDIVDDQGTLQTNIDSVSLSYPPVLVVPIMKFANKQAIDEVYFQVSIINGVITTSGTLPSAGNWQMTTARVNEALKAINADWQFGDASTNFIVS